MGTSHIVADCQDLPSLTDVWFSGGKFDPLPKLFRLGRTELESGLGS